MDKAVFLDRDGTLIELVHYLRRPEDVALYPDAAIALELFRQAGYRCVVVTNQSVIGRGLLTEEGLTHVHEELRRQLADAGTSVDGIYYCPVAPEVSDPTVIEHPERKPGPGMLLRAAEDLNLDLGESWMIGDTVSDLLAGRNAGCRASILVRTGYGSRTEAKGAPADHVVDNILAAARLITGKSADSSNTLDT